MTRREATKFGAPELLARVGAELLQMSSDMVDVEHALSLVLERQSGSGNRQVDAKALQDLQHIDRLRQSLVDIAILLDGVASGQIDPEDPQKDVLKNFALRDLGARLLNAETPAEDRPDRLARGQVSFF